MSRYIDADLLLAKCRRNPLFEKTEKDKEMLYIERSIIDEIPTADVVEVRHGRWLSAYEYALKIGATDEKLIENAKKDKLWEFCCHCEQPVKWNYHYCPTCGARMDGERKEE